MEPVDEDDRLIDPRRALGRRPGAAPPRLQIDDSALYPPSPTFNAPPSPRSRQISLSIPVPSPAASSSSQSVSTPSPSSPSTTRKFRRPTISRAKQQKVSLRGLYETQKLLSHLLDRLEARDPAPDLLSRAAISAREVAGRKKAKAKGRVVRIGQVVAAAAHTGLSVAQNVNSTGTGRIASGSTSASGIGSEDVDEQILLEEGDWDTEGTYDLVEQMRGLLVLADKQSLDIFASDNEVRSSSPTNVRTTNIKRKTGRFTSFASPIAARGGSDGEPSSPTTATSGNSDSNFISGQGLLDRLLVVLRSLVEVDCLHRTHAFRLLRPPSGLQMACLDIASWLYHQCGWGVKVEAVEIVAGGLMTMGQGMMERGIEWLEGRMLELLQRLEEERGGTERRESTSWQDPFAKPKQSSPLVPTFAFSAEPDSTTLPASSPGWIKYSPTSPTAAFGRDNIAGILAVSSSTTSISPLTLRLASLVPRILLAVSSNIDISTSKLTTIHRVHRLLAVLLSAKPDSALDLLDIVAYGPLPSRRTAVEILATFYPGLTGHNAIARRPPLSTYTAQRTKWETGQDKVLGENDTESHHFVPWRISKRDGASDTDGACSTCRGDIHGFCLKCTLCKEYRHLHCYSHAEEGQGFSYEVTTISSRDSAPHMVYVKFSLCPPRLDEQLLDGSTKSGDLTSTRRKIGQHDLRLVNLFSATMCEECRLLLWGSTAQAYACLNGCQRFFHAECVDSLRNKGKGECRFGRDVMVDEVAAIGRNPFDIDPDSLRSSFESATADLRVETDDLSSRTYDEVAIMYGALWIQYQLLKNGLTAGAIRLFPMKSKQVDSDPVGIRPYLKSYEEILRTEDTGASSAATDYAHISNLGRMLGQGYLFSDRYLTYCTALLRSPSPPGRPASPTPSDGYLAAQPMDRSDSAEVDEVRNAYETLSLSTLTRTLASDMNIHNPALATVFLEHLRGTGLVSVANNRTISAADVRSGTKQISFGLPLLMDSSPTVESLILAIEILLSDIDLTMNEVGLSLLTNRAWPSLLCSPYSLERLGSALIRWVMNEDETIHQVVKQYASKHKRLPGVRAGAKGNSSVQIYKEDRKSLEVRYGHPWLRAMHDQDPGLYAHIVYEECKCTDGLPIRANAEPDEAASIIAAKALERMTTMVDGGIMFSVHLDLLTAWLEDLGALASKDLVYRSLPRLLRHTKTVQRQTEDEADIQDIWSLSRLTLNEGPDGLARVCKWFRVLSFSGVDVPWDLLVQMIDQQTNYLSPFEQTEEVDHDAPVYDLEARLDLVIAVNANGASIDPQEFATLCCKLLAGFVAGDGQASSTSSTGLAVLRQNLLVILRSYGVSLDEVAQTRLGTPDMHAKQPASLSKKRRHTISASLMTMDETIIASVVSLLQNRRYPTEIVLDFMWLLFTRSTAAVNIDGFLHKQCAAMYPILWELLDHDVERKARARVFLRLLAVNSAPMEMMIKHEFHQGDRTILRERLLRFTLELADDALTADNLSWRRASVGLVILFYEALLDHTDVGPDNMVILRSILPTQLAAISSCFEEYLVQSSDERRLSLMARLHRLRIALPSWPVLSWRVLEDLLVETNGTITQITPARSSQTMSALLDAQQVRANLVALGLDMLSTGIEIPWVVAQRFQAHVGQAVSSITSTPGEAVSTLVLPALRAALDSSQRITIGSGAIDSRTKKTALVGALFVPIIIDLAADLHTYDFSTQRVLLDIMYIAFFKQSTRTVELGALGALQSLAEFVEKTSKVAIGQSGGGAVEGSGENRLLAIGILQLSIARVDKDSLVRAMPIVFATMANVLVKETEADGDSAILEQTRIFLRTVVKTFGRSRLFVQLFKNDATVVSSPQNGYLSRALQILRAAERPSADGTVKFSVVDLAINDLPDVLKRDRRTVEHVLISFERFVSVLEDPVSEDAILHFGGFVTRLGKHIAEWHSNEFDPNPILRSCAEMMRLAPGDSSVMLLHQTSTMLHLALSRFMVDRETMVRLLHASEGVAVVQNTENTIKTVFFELAGAALRGSTVGPTTLDTLLRFIEHHSFPPRGTNVPAKQAEKRLLGDSAGGCMSILLRSHPTMNLSTDPETTISTLSQAATILLKGEVAISGLLSHHLSTIIPEAAGTQLGVFTSILFASLDVHLGREGKKAVLGLYPALGRAVSLCLRASADLLGVVDAGGEGVERVSSVFAVLRVALLAAGRAGRAGEHDGSDGQSEGEDGGGGEGGKDEGEVAADKEGDEAVESFWSRIWPDWYRLLALSVESKCVNAPLKSIAHTVFLDTLIFFGAVRSSILIRHAGSLNHALRMMRRVQGSVGYGVGKMIKAERAVREVGVDVGPGEALGMVDLERIKGSVRGDLIAGERLRGLRAGSG